MADNTMSDFGQVSASPRTFVMTGPVSFMSILSLAVLQLTMIAIIFLIFYYYWFATAITKVQEFAGGSGSNHGRSLNRSVRSIFGLDDVSAHVEPWRKSNGKNQNEELEMAARIDEAIQHGQLLNSN